MSALPKLQRDFQSYVYVKDGRMPAEVVGTVRATAAERLDVYADAYRLRLLEVIEDDFPGLQAIVGLEKFEQLGRTYIESRPSKYFNARWYAEGMDTFLNTSKPWSAEPALAEMAALEWAMTLAFDAADEPTLTVEAMATIPPDAWAGMTPVIQGGARCLRLHWNVAAIRNATDQETGAPELRQLEAPQENIVWRRDLTVYYRALETDEAWALGEAQRGTSFAELCEGLCAWAEPAEVAVRAAAILRRWVEDGLIREIRLESESP